MKRPALLAGLALAGSSVLAGCGANTPVTATLGGLPLCTAPAGRVNGGLLIQAQSVPSAQWLPCVRDIPIGWGFADLVPKDGESTFSLNSERDGDRAVAVVLAPSCTHDGTTEVPSEQPEMRRYERVARVSHGYAGDRFYTFDGGCVTYRFNLRGTTRAEPVATISASLSFISRTTLANRLQEVSGGRLRLDPTAAGPG